MREIFMEFTPVLGEVDCTPAAGDGGEVGCVGWDHGMRGEDVTGIEGATTGEWEFEVFLLVEAYAVEIGGGAIRFGVVASAVCMGVSESRGRVVEEIAYRYLRIVILIHA
jgi:hypothetical protein